MVYIKRLTLQGFKSFGPRRATLSFEKGLVVVTGPNGGGKSNIMDAIRFALGELSAHNLRVGRMSELVHDKPSVSSAKVSITLDNSDGALPVDSPEVTISRRIDRSGESEYLLNGRSVSRMELLTLLSMANIKPSGFNIIPQGSVIEIAEMSGVELRRMLEEVAGIGDYEKKRQEAEQQLAAAERNIAIAKASTSEVRLRVKQLERERNQAYRRAQVELLLNSLKASRLKASLEAMERELGEVDAESLALEGELERVGRERERISEEQEKVEAEWRDASERLRALEEEIKALESERSRLGAEVGELRVRASVMEERARRLGEELPYVERRLGELRGALLEVSETLESEERVLAERLGELEGARRAREDAQREVERLENLIGELGERVEARRRRLESERSNFKARAAAARARVRELGKLLERLRLSASNSRSRLEQALLSATEAEKNLGKLEARKGELEERLKGLGEKLQSLREKLSRARELERRLSDSLERAGASGLISGESKRSKLLEAIRASGLQGIYGFLDEEIEAENDVWRLLEAATEGWVHGLVVESWGLAAGLARALAEVGLSVKLIPLDMAQAASPHLKLPELEVKSGWAQRALSYLTAGVELGGRPALPAKGLRRVSSGVVFHADGRVEAPAGRHAILSHLLTLEYERAAEALGRLRERVERLGRELEEAAGEEARLSREILKLDAEARALKAEANRAYEAAAEAILEEAEALAERSRVVEELRSAALEIAEAEKRLRALRGEGLDDELRRLAELEEELRSAKAAHEEARLKLAELEMGFESSKRRVEELRASRERLLTEVSELEERLERLRARSREAGEEGRAALERLREAEERLREVERALERLGAERERLRAGAEELRDRITRLAQERRKLEESFQELSSKRTSLAVRRAHLEGELTRVKESLESLGARGQPLPELPEDLRSELERALEEELRELGMINQLAPRQYEELVGNYKLRSSRIRELEEERREILRFIEWVEGEKRRAFMETFDKVSEAFEGFFTRLTGGHGWLRLENQENPFDGGVEMIVRFPGKGARSARSASGGEKSVAAVALLLALQGLTPAEFYVFDEVDAHMDLQYSLRLAQLLKEMAQRTQIIVISLKDVVAEQADQLIGVYMSRGESKAVRTELEEAKALG